MIKKKKILIVEDEVVTAMDLWHILELWGYEMCEQVSKGEEAMRVAEKERPDIMLIDINLDGGISGLEAAEQISSRFGIPFIFITGYSDPEMKKQAEQLKPAGYFIKPIDYYKLKETIESITHTNS
jgi:DNA-binding NtrC family response regulator